MTARGWKFSLVAMGTFAATPALAQDVSGSGMTNDMATAIEGKASAEDSTNEPAREDGEAKERKKAELLVVPIPLSNPVVGTGVTLVGVMFYNPNHSSQPWITGVGGMYTSNKSWAGAAFHSMSLAEDKIRVMAFAGYANVNVNFYGIGPNAGDRDVSVDLQERGLLGLVQGQYRLAKNVYAGARYMYVNLDTSLEDENPRFPDLIPPGFQLNNKLSAVGPAITYDSRNNSLNPTKGSYVTAVGMFNIKDLGSDYSYNKWQVSANGYLPVMPGSTLAVHGGLCAESKGAPFFDLCLYGQGNDLRGYEAGRYRDRAYWTMQAEWRQHLGGKFGAVFFAGIGGIAPSIEDLDNTTMLPSAGMGLRYLAAKENGVNLRLDWAIGKDTDAIYFGIGEAF